jgi:hypothetical protein
MMDYCDCGKTRNVGDEPCPHCGLFSSAEESRIKELEQFIWEQHTAQPNPIGTYEKVQEILNKKWRPE